MLAIVKSSQDLASRIESRIHSRTHGRVRDLQVELAEQTVVLRGRAPTYYAKQLAQHGALEVSDGQPVVNAIDVE